MKYQNLYNIIFSDKRSLRWKRHFLFWLAVFFYHLVRIGLMLPSFSMDAVFALLKTTFFWGILPTFLFTYSIVYYLIPKFFNRKKYISFFAGVLVFIVLLPSYAIVWNILSNNQIMDNAIGLSKDLWRSSFRPGFIRIFGNPPLIFGLFLSLKTLKNWHLEQLKTETLAKENTNAELQLLKAQVHPHFLFNTLNNIYSFTLTQSPLAGKLLQKLSDMLHYMIHECEQPLVPLEKEIKLVQDYMGLEKVRYGNRLTINVEIEGNCENKLITPLLIIPFVENSFKHGASVMRGQQWINLRIQIKEDQLDFNLSNSKPPQTNGTKIKNGIGLANVQKRLQLLYPGKHFLKIESTSDTYSVHLQLRLHQEALTKLTNNRTPMLQPV